MAIRNGVLYVYFRPGSYSADVKIFLYNFEKSLLQILIFIGQKI